MNLTTALITGLTTGALTCLAVQGGLLIGLLARRDEDAEASPRGWRRMLLPVAAFLIAKITVHTILGLGLGWFGDQIALTATIRIWLQAIAGTFMVLTGIRLIFPSFLPWLTIMPPSAMRRFIRQRAKSRTLIAPAVLGLLTVFIPCGTTQAMEVAAIATGNAAQAAGIMFGFTLGTAPLFLLVGVLAKGTVLLQRKLTYAAATLVVLLGLYTLNGVLILTDSPYEAHNVARSVAQGLTRSGDYQADAADAETNPTITVSASGYRPNEVTVPAGSPVTFTLKTKGRLGCTSIFTIPQLDIERDLSTQPTTTITTTFKKPGRYTYTCGMGMYRGVINAI